MGRLDLYEKIKLTHDVFKEEQSSEPCEWQHETDWGGDYWQTKCGNAFRFCPYCGQPCETKKTEEQS